MINIFIWNNSYIPVYETIESCADNSIEEIYKSSTVIPIIHSLWEDTVNLIESPLMRGLERNIR